LRSPSLDPIRRRGSNCRRSSSDIDIADDPGAEQRSEPVANDRGRSLDLALPGRFFRAHVEHAVDEADRRRVGHLRPDGGTPREGHFLGRQRRLAQNFGERRRHDALNRDHRHHLNRLT
jgi:hypothetical protein